MLPKHQVKRKALERRQYHSPDMFLAIAIGVLLIFGLVSLSSASSVIAYNKFGDPYHFLKSQLLSVAIGVVGFWFFSRTDYRFWKNYAFHFLLLSIGLLLLVFVPFLTGDWGTSRSWIKIFGFSLQPSELVKISFLLYLSAWLESRKDELANIYRGIGIFVGLMGVIALLLLLQPDFGTLSILAATSLIVYFVGGGKMTHIMGIIGVGFILFLVMINLKPYQMNRIKCTIDPSFSKNEICYQINQSLIAVGSGGIFGRGLGESRQKYLYLPVANSDFIFAIIAEETGLIFGSLLIGLYVFIFYRGFLIAKKAPDLFGQNLAIGIVSWISIQAMLNIGGIINIIPMTGVPLPLVSSGGSAIIAALAASGILINISKQTTR